MDKNKVKKDEALELDDDIITEIIQNPAETGTDQTEEAAEVLSDESDNSEASYETVAGNEDGTDDAKESVTSFENMTVSELYSLADSFSGENVIEDIGSEAFRIFAKGKSGDANQIYSEFLKLKKTFDAPARGKSGQEKERANFGFDRYAPSKDPSAGLTRRQMELARSSGMSFREYEELLSSVPSGRRFGVK